jgi:hypothetical protein
MEDLLPHMRARIDQLRKVMALAHDPRMIQMIQEIIDTGEADIARLEAERAQVAPVPPPTDIQA